MITVDGRQGRVARVTSRYVVVRSLDGIEAIVPNETLVTTTVLNHSSASHDIRDRTCRSRSPTTADLDMALRLMEEAARRASRGSCDRAEPPTAIVTAFADNGINLELVLWVTGPAGGHAGRAQQAQPADFRGVRGERHCAFPIRAAISSG